MKKKSYKYFVSYFHNDGFGMGTVILGTEIKNFKDLMEVSMILEEKNGWNDHSVVILNYQLMRVK